MIDTTSPDAYAVGKPINNITRMANGKWRVRMRTGKVSQQVFSQATVDSLASALERQQAWQTQIDQGTMPAELVMADGAIKTGRNARDLLPEPPKLVARPGTIEFTRLEEKARKTGLNTPAIIALTSAMTFAQAANEYERAARRAPSDIEVVNSVVRDAGDELLTQMATQAWALKYVASMQSEDFHYSPGTIRKRIEAAARVLDHHITSRINSPIKPAIDVNPLRKLPTGYSEYPHEHEAPKFDQKRERRMTEAEAEAIEKIFRGEKPEGYERAIFEPDHTDELELFYHLLVNAGVRMREGYMLRVADINREMPWMRVRQSKDAKKKKTPRPVALLPWLHAKLLKHCEGKNPFDLVFGFWDGVNTDESKDATSNKLSGRFATLFEHAKMSNFTTHDLRHEAACRTVLMRKPDGNYVFPDSVIIKMFGWTKPDMLQRYLSLRGDDVAEMMLAAFGMDQQKAA